MTASSLEHPGPGPAPPAPLESGATAERAAPPSLVRAATPLAVHFALLSVQVLFGLWPVAGQAVLGSLSPSALTAWRLAVGAPLLMLAVRPWVRGRAGPRDLAVLFGLALLGISANQIMYVEGLARAGSINAAILVTTIPVLTVGFAGLLGRERPTPARVGGIAVAMVGALVLIGGERLSLADGATFGNLLLVGNCSAYALYLALARPTLARVGTLQATAWLFSFGALQALPWVGADALATDWAALSPATWLWLGFILLGPTLGTYLLNAYALARTDPSLVAAYIFVQPTVGLVAAWLVFGAIPGLRAVIACALIFVGLALALRLLGGPARPPQGWPRRPKPSQ